MKKARLPREAGFFRIDVFLPSRLSRRKGTRGSGLYVAVSMANVPRPWGPVAVVGSFASPASRLA